MLAVFRNWKNKNTQQDVERVKRLLKEKLSIDNHVTLEWVLVKLFVAGNFYSFLPLFVCRVEYCKSDSVDPETHESHEEYLAAFKRTLIEKLRQCIDNSLTNDPDGGKVKRKTVQVRIRAVKLYEPLCRRTRRENLFSGTNNEYKIGSRESVALTAI